MEILKLDNCLTKLIFANDNLKCTAALCSEVSSINQNMIGNSITAATCYIDEILKDVSEIINTLYTPAGIEQNTNKGAIES